MSIMCSIDTVIQAYILAGGQSRRFGQDKARVELNGKTLIQRLADLLKSWDMTPTMVAREVDQYADLGLTTIADLRPNMGPLGGLESALHDLLHKGPEQARWLLLLTCDCVVLNKSWINTLVQACNNEVKIVAFRNNRVEPMPALYHIDLQDQVKQQLDDKRLKMQDLIKRTALCAVPLPADWPAVMQVNTPEDLIDAESQMNDSQQT